MTAPADAYDPAALPDSVATCLDARDEGRTADALATFAPGAVVQDDGGTYDGLDAIGA